MSNRRDYFGKDAARLDDKKLFLLDMDGTIYLDDDMFDGSSEFLSKIRSDGGRYVFITNNASKSVDDYVKKMRRIGLSDATSEDFFTSSQATAMMLLEKHRTAKIYAQGTASFLAEMRKFGLDITTEYTDDADVILVAFDTELTGEKLYTTCKMLTKHDLPYYATNPDWVCPVEFGYIPDCGSMCEGIWRATGKRPIFIGKPEPTMVLTVMKKFGYSAQETVVIGDRLYTDVASGNNAGVDTVCVLSGETTLDEIKAAKGSHVPTFVFESVKDLL